MLRGPPSGRRFPLFLGPPHRGKGAPRPGAPGRAVPAAALGDASTEPRRKHSPAPAGRFPASLAGCGAELGSAPAAWVSAGGPAEGLRAGPARGAGRLLTGPAVLGAQAAGPDGRADEAVAQLREHVLFPRREEPAVQGDRKQEARAPVTMTFVVGGRYFPNVGGGRAGFALSPRCFLSLGLHYIHFQLLLKGMISRFKNFIFQY